MNRQRCAALRRRFPKFLGPFWHQKNRGGGFKAAGRAPGPKNIVTLPGSLSFWAPALGRSARTYIHTYVYVHTYVRASVRTHIHMYMHIHTHLHMYIHMYIHMYMHMYLRTYVLTKNTTL